MPKSDQGLDQSRYVVVPRTLIFLFDAQNRVLLLKGAADKRLWAGLYNGIGGHIERGEDIVEAANRELFEETGLCDVYLHYCAQVTVDVNLQTGVAIFIFKGFCENAYLKGSSEGNLEWLYLDEIDRISTVEDLPILLPMIAAHQEADPIIIGKYTYGLSGELKISLR